MGLELRNGELYYYRKRRIGRAVKSTYVGSGMVAAVAAILDEKEREEARKRAAVVEEHWRARRGTMEAAEALVASHLRTIDEAVRRALLTAGYDRPSRKLMWMKRMERQPENGRERS
jgi:hypothetical protein